MIGIVSRVTTAGVWVRVDSTYPGQELGPLPAAIRRNGGTVDALTTDYAEDDRVLIIEDTPNDFIVLTILKGGDA